MYAGPAEGLPQSEWKLKSPATILNLKICDPACGSAAFLVAAARYLAARLTESWDRLSEAAHTPPIQITPYGDPATGENTDELLPADPAERYLLALRLIVERCLYGVDRNPLAVEMAKLSLWLLTMQRNRPFTFVDHAIVPGDSLLGVTLAQLNTFSLSGTQSKQHFLPFQEDLRYAADKREGLAKLQFHPDDQERLLAEANAKTRRLRAASDLLIATAFENNPEELQQQIFMQLEQQEEHARTLLGTNRPFHWPVEFPEVFLDNHGFDAIVGNPPFIGGQRITGALGTAYREYLVHYIGNSVRGSADYVAYFFLRAWQFLKEGGTAGLLATNTIAQGDTREVGLDQLTARGAAIFRAIPSRKWPGDASLEVAHVWWRKGPWSADCYLDDSPVPAVTSQLTPPGSVTGKPFRLAANAGKSFQGSNVLGLGFVLDPDTAQRLLDKDPRNKDVLFPYLNGEDLNSRWDQSPSRWVINFHDWPLERAREYPDCFEIVERLVKPEREQKSYSPRARDRWWLFERSRPELYATIASLDRVLVRTQTSRTQLTAFVPRGWVYGHKLIVFTGGTATLALLDSHIHYHWVISRGSSMRTDPVYTPSDCFETFPPPENPEALASIGKRYDDVRSGIMTASLKGLTATYSMVHTERPSDDGRILQRLHVEIDYAVLAAYRWTDVELDHGIHETKWGPRFTISEHARRIVLDRLLALNHQRYAAEQAAASTAPKPKKRAVKTAAAPEQISLL